MKINKFKKMMAKGALPLILGGAVVAAGAGGAYYYANQQGDKLATSEKQPAQTETQTKSDVTTADKSADTTTVAPTTPVDSTSVGDVSLNITIDDPSVRNTATVSFYGPAGTFGVEKLVGGSWTTVVAKFSYSGSGGRVIDTISSGTAETHYRVYSLSGDTRTATSGDTTVKWSLVNENGIYTIPVAR